MSFLNVEIKARCTDADTIERTLMNKGAKYHGLDHQVDTYFKVPHGRLKLRQGKIENNLIHYVRNDQPGPKDSQVSLCPGNDGENLKDVLSKSNGILCVVDKQRKIFFIDNVKFHLDEVNNLGSFVEIEAIDTTGDRNKEHLLEQCKHYIGLFNIAVGDLISVSYSDLIIRQKLESTAL